MWGRYVVSGGLSLIVSTGLFFLMQVLVATSDAKISHDKGGRVADFVRERRAEVAETKKRELPEQGLDSAEPEAPHMDLGNVGDGNAGSIAPTALKVEAPSATDGLKLEGGPHLGEATDTDIVPLVRVQPVYPQAAAERHLEGWVRLEFTISVTGTVKDARVIDSDPPGVFDQAALRALKKWKYKPQVENGKATEARGIKVQLTFTLENEE